MLETIYWENIKMNKGGLLSTPKLMTSLCCHILNGVLVGDLFILHWFGMKTKVCPLMKLAAAEYPSWLLLSESNICCSFTNKGEKMNKEGLGYSLMIDVQPWAHDCLQILEGLKSPKIDIFHISLGRSTLLHINKLVCRCFHCFLVKALPYWIFRFMKSYVLFVFRSNSLKQLVNLGETMKD